MRHIQPQVDERDQHSVDELQFWPAPGSHRAFPFPASLFAQEV
jgi:hypothetical protein